MTIDALGQALARLALVIGPVAIAGAALHQLNVLTTRVLGETFGPRAVVWFTGWLGTPIHELSHAAACVLFAHRIQELVLFRPDPATGVVGYVRYTWSPRNPWALLGHGFVGIAPLFGGAAALVLLLVALVPGEHVAPLLHPHAAEWIGAVERQIAALLAPDVLARPRTWLFAYLALCVGTHLAPSGPDLRGAWPSLALGVALALVADLVVGRWFTEGAAWLTIPVVAVLALAAALVGLAFVGVLGAAIAWSTVRGRPLAPIRTALREPWRLAAVVAVGAWAATCAAP